MPTVIDLFSGAGGLSLGAARAGFTVSGSVEIDPFAIQVHKLNFPKAQHLPLDIGTLSGKRLLASSNLKSGQLCGLIGGPPCQGFSSIGHRMEGDERNDLFAHFFRLVSETNPAFFVAENVPGILDERYDTTRERAFANVPKKYRMLPPVKIQADQFGVPTTRTRIFFIGFDPKRFRQPLSPDLFAAPSEGLLTTVGEALRGLPEFIDPAWQTAEEGWRPVKKNVENWFFERVKNAVPADVGDPISLERYLERDEVSGCMGTRHTAEVLARFANTIPGRVDQISKAIRLKHDGLCPTLRAGTAKERGSYQAVRPIHYSQPRVITAREAARLQGFPDWFIFHETKWHSFRQIGNSVSPLVAEFILKRIYLAVAG
ncbi:DNA cytosine methyltransferase [Paraburkholderia nodosa]|uniref:DNA cytosine methyltransferase n=1 Tax=Paraburkholderia nodosa TaxID=392320 RepID=UPI0008422447|nr:DNA cytosine methyltransferase [Paraburkholderia nodosa]